MPRISEINPETAPEAIQKIIADHLADGHALTAEKRTLLHNAAAFNAVEAGSYALDDELQRLIGKRAADFYEYAISQKNGCLVCSIYFQNLLKKNGIDFEHFAFMGASSGLQGRNRGSPGNRAYSPLAGAGTGSGAGGNCSILPPYRSLLQQSGSESGQP